MDIREQLLAAKDKMAARAIMQELVQSKSKMEQVLDALESNEKILCQRASWPLTMVADEHSDLLLPYLPRLLGLLEQPIHNTIIRNVCRILAFLPEIPEDYEGKVYDLCFPILEDPKQAIANRVFSMIACTNIAVKYTDLVPELIAVIKMHLPDGSPGFRSRGHREIARLQKVVE